MKTYLVQIDKKESIYKLTHVVKTGRMGDKPIIVPGEVKKCSDLAELLKYLVKKVGE
jgi:hypothetical protein